MQPRQTPKQDDLIDLQSLPRPTALAVITNTLGEILIIKTGGGTWSLPQGGIHVEEENAEEGLYRELNEELGIKQQWIRQCEFIGSFTKKRTNSKNRHSAYGGQIKYQGKEYFCYRISTFPLKFSPDTYEIREIFYISRDNCFTSTALERLREMSTEKLNLVITNLEMPENEKTRLREELECPVQLLSSKQYEAIPSSIIERLRRRLEATFKGAVIEFAADGHIRVLPEGSAMAITMLPD